MGGSVGHGRVLGAGLCGGSRPFLECTLAPQGPLRGAAGGRECAEMLSGGEYHIHSQRDITTPNHDPSAGYEAVGQ